jgi:hypothetical protein
LVVNSKNIYCPPPIVSNDVKFVQFDEGMGKIHGVWCKGIQCSMMGELKHIKISSLKSLIIASLFMEYKEVLTSSSWCTHHVFNYSKLTKNEEDVGLELERV